MLDRKLKIVSWNSCGKFREKFQLISKFKADVLIIQECEDPMQSKDLQYKQFACQRFWTGENKHKGLGIFCLSSLAIEPLQWENFGLRNFLPIRINDTFNLLGVWACKPYIEEFFIYEKIHHNKLNANDVIMGDFNSNACWDRQHGKRNHTEVTSSLKERGLDSAYHVIKNERLGQETEPTFCLYRKLDRQYHIDYCFCDPSRIIDFKIHTELNWLAYSDHFPIEVTLKI